MLVTRISTGPSAVGDLAGQRREPLEVAGVGLERRSTSPPISDAASSSRSRERLAIATLAPSRASAAGDPAPDPPAGAHHQRDPSLDPEVHAATTTLG